MKYVKLFEEYKEPDFYTNPVDVKRIIEDWSKTTTTIYNTQGWKVNNLFIIDGSYIIHPNGTVDVDGNVYIKDLELTNIPIQFGKVSGTFECKFNKLLSLKGSPFEVGVDFTCNDNKLTTLEYAPLKVGGDFMAYRNPLVTDAVESNIEGSKYTSEINSTVNHLYKLYVNYLEGVAIDHQNESILWLSRMDIELNNHFIEMSRKNNFEDVFGKALSDRVKNVYTKIGTQNKRMPLL